MFRVPPETHNGSNIFINLQFALQIVVVNLGSDTFGNLIFQKVLQNQPSPPIIIVQVSFA